MTPLGTALRLNTGCPAKLLARNLFAFGAAGLPEVTQPALFDRAIGKLKRDFRRPSRLGFQHTFHDADCAGCSMHHCLANVALAGCR